MSTPGATVEVRVPALGDFKDVPVIAVLVSVGQAIEENDALVTVESDKATMDVPAPFAGIVREVCVKPGDRVGETSLLVRVERGAVPAAAAAVAAAVATAAVASGVVAATVVVTSTMAAALAVTAAAGALVATLVVTSVGTAVDAGCAAAAPTWAPASWKAWASWMPSPTCGPIILPTPATS